jgi:glycosyltransferase involved in cell wall biosynthesis
VTYAPGVDRPILINARAAVRPQITGVERWAREMTARLPQLRPHAYRVAAPPIRFAHSAGHLWEQGALPLMAARMRASLIFSPASLAPLAWPRNVALMHDAAVLRHPELYGRAYIAWERRILPAIARRAQRVITVSEHSRQEIVSLLDAPPERVVVVSPGVGERFSPAADAEGTRAALQLDRPYVLTVAASGLRKNLRALSQTAGRLREAGMELVIAGGTRAHLSPDAGVEGARSLGYVAEELLPGLYAGAGAFVLPSLHEGFGLPVIEAMACGTPVVASNRGALPETCGDAALLVDPQDASAIAEAVLAVALDEAVAHRLRESGLARAAHFSWDRAAREVDAVLSEAAAQGRPPLA